MATTKLIPLHINKGKTIAQTLNARTNYAANPDKTNGGELVTGYECDPHTADVEFLLAKKQYENYSSKAEGDKNIIAYQIRQSFKPGEITPELANKIGYELAMRFTKGKHQFIVATHIDKNHVHNHVIFNSTALDYTRKFRNFWGSSFAIGRISDQLCIENGLSVVENPSKKSKHYGAWFKGEKPLTWSDKLRNAIDAVFVNKPADISEFVQAMQAAGYEVKQGKYLSFRAPEQKKFIRLRSLGNDYNDDAILERIAGKKIVVLKGESKIITQTTSSPAAPKFNLLIDIQNNIKAQNSPGYEEWAKLFNLKQAAKTLIYLQENKLTEYKKLEEKTKEAAQKFDDLAVQIKQKEKRLAEITTLQKNIGAYSKTRNIYVEYKKSGYNKKFYAEHKNEIELHKSAKKAFDELKLNKIPSIKELQTEYATVLAEKKKLYSGYKEAKEILKELVNAKSNTDRLLNYSSGREKTI